MEKHYGLPTYFKRFKRNPKSGSFGDQDEDTYLVYYYQEGGKTLDLQMDIWPRYITVKRDAYGKKPANEMSIGFSACPIDSDEGYKNLKDPAKVTVTRQDIASITNTLGLAAKNLPVNESNVRPIYLLLNFWMNDPEKWKKVEDIDEDEE